MSKKIHEDAEVVLNLWAYSDEQGYVRRIAGKCYTLYGNDSEKLDVLRILSRSDYLTAKWELVPERYGLINLDGTEELRVATTNEVMDVHEQAQLFDELIERLEADLPVQLVRNQDGCTRYRTVIPQEPLAIRTIVIESDNGQLVPILNPY